MSGLRETYVSLEFRDDASSSLRRIDNLLDTISNSFSSLGSTADGSTAGFAGMSQEITQMNNRLDNANSTIIGMNSEISQSNQEMTELRTIASQLERALQEARQQMQQLTSGTNQLNGNVGDTSNSFNNMSSHINRIDNLLESIGNSFASFNAQVNSSASNFADMSQEINRLNNRLDDANNTIASMHAEISRSNQEMADLRTIVARLEQELQDARQEIQDLNQNTQQLNNNAKQAAGSFGDLAGSVAGIAASLGALSFGASLVSEAMEMDEAFGRLQARTGATSDELEEYKSIAKDVFVGGFTENIGEATDSVSTFGAMFKNLEWTDLGEVTKGAHTIAAAWDQEAKQVGKTVATMTKTFDGLSETEALDLITVGFQRTGDHSEDLLDTFNEYSTQFKALGYDAEGFTATLIAGAESGKTLPHILVTIYANSEYAGNS